MKIDLLDIEKLIKINKLQEVTSPGLFTSGMMYDPDGVLSDKIFGTKKSEKMGTYAYINLKRPFLHPHIYGHVLKRIMRNKIAGILSGTEKFSIQNGVIVPDENGWTGIGNLYKYWDEIDWSKSTSTMERSVKLLYSTKKDRAFITRMIVCPPAYRDVTSAGAVDKSDYVPEINKLYTSLIGRCNNLLDDGGSIFNRQYKSEYDIQELLLEISEHFKNLIEKKYGLIKQNLIGKNVDFGSRSVISAFNYNNETVHENMVGVEYAAVPISHCCSAFYPFIKAWLMNYFTREVIDDAKHVIFYDEKTKKERIATVKNPEEQFAENRIEKIINDYCFNPDNRFHPIKIKATIPFGEKTREVEMSMMFKGKEILPNNVATTINRALTYTDLLYLACVDVCEKRHVMISRYPVGTDKGLVFAKIRVQSTRKHVNVIFNGNPYPFYPYIDFNTPRDHVGVQFVDSLVFSPSLCAGLGEPSIAPRHYKK
jgi:hypothetical protein